MGTKNNPGAFDCHANAKPDEPMFVLLGRDPGAWMLVMMWANVREAMGEDPAVVQEAQECALAMRAYAVALGKDLDPTATRHLELMRQASDLFRFVSTDAPVTPDAA